ncbi:hypothetical protein C8035_v002008 [Colletotrichum spinosum]|uniref:Uncharacterized protein n=1 Tax=Colletotrichum spinosum TaxID=1347390 RepID=A0A4R8Q5J8_9PEZI|nr:hypothetical protein C8035_v002008 [Colletotrichum spinosum]
MPPVVWFGANLQYIDRRTLRQLQKFPSSISLNPLPPIRCALVDETGRTTEHTLPFPTGLILAPRISRPPSHPLFSLRLGHSSRSSPMIPQIISVPHESLTSQGREKAIWFCEPNTTRTSVNVDPPRCIARFRHLQTCYHRIHFEVVPKASSLRGEASRDRAHASRCALADRHST